MRHSYLKRLLTGRGTPAVVADPPVATSVPTPTSSGSWVAGQTVTASTPTSVPSGATKSGFIAYSDDPDTSIGSVSGYVIQSGDVGRSFKARWVITQRDGQSITVYSSSTEVVTSIGGGGGPPTIETTLETSITHGSATFRFSVPVPVARYVGGQPFVVSDRNFTITQIEPDGASVASGTFLQAGVSKSGQSYVKNGAMVNPWIPTGSSQGFDGLLGVYKDGTGQTQAIIPYDASLNVDPAMSGAYSVSVGDAKSIVKSVRRDGMTTPGQWRHFDDWCVLHIISSAPPVGAFAPSPSDLDKSSLFKLSDLDKSALGDGFAYSSGMPSQATVISEDYFHGFQPYFAQLAEPRRRMVIDLVTERGGNTTPYSREYSRVWSKALAAILAEGQAADDDLYYKMIDFGLHILGVLNRGYAGNSGAGQDNGHVQFVWLVGHSFHAAMPTLMDRVRQIKGNCNMMQFWVHDFHVGQDCRWPGNHSVYMFTPTNQHLGKPVWSPQVIDRLPINNNEIDVQVDADYGATSNLASFLEVTCIALLKNGPGGRDGSQTFTGMDTWSSTRTDQAASLAYYDCYRTFCTSKQVYGLKQDSLADPASRNFYDDRRADCLLPRYSTTPEAFTPDTSKTSNWLTATTDGFSWDLTGAGHATETVLEYNIQYSLDRLSWSNTSTQAVSGTQSGRPSTKHYVRWRWRSASGWGPWSENVPHTSTTSERLIVTPTGAPSGAPTNTSAPVIVQTLYPMWLGPSYEVSSSPVSPTRTLDLACSTGDWSGDLTGGFVYKWQRDSVDIVGATSKTYTWTSSDRGKSLRCGVSADAGSSWTYSNAVSIPSLSSPPAGTIINSGLNSADFVLTSVYSSFVSNSSAGTVTLLPVYIRPDNTGTSTLADGIIRFKKTSANPALIGNLAADVPLTPGTTYTVTVDIGIGLQSVPISANTTVDFGTTSAFTTLYTTQTVISASGYPKVQTITFTFTPSSGQTALWIRVKVPTGTGGTAGGDPTITRIVVTS